MKAELVTRTGTLSNGDYYAIEVTLPQGETFVLRMSDHEYHRVASRLTGLDEPNQECAQMAVVLGHIAQKLSK